MDVTRCLPSCKSTSTRPKDSHYGEEAKFHVLTAVEEVVEVPQILGPWHDGEQKSREQNEYTASHGTDLRTPVHQRSARGGSLFHSLSLNLRLITGL
jgi:hypothetical protein